MTSALLTQVAPPLPDAPPRLVPSRSNTTFTLKRIPWGRRLGLLLQGKQSPKWSTAK